MALSWRRARALLTIIVLLASLIPNGIRAQQDMDEIGSADFVLVIDHSGSMKDNDPENLRLAAAKLFVDLADPGDRIGVIVMSGSRETRRLTPQMVDAANFHSLKRLIDGLRNERMGQYTHMGSALNLAYDLLATTEGRANQRQFVVLLTDGLPTGEGQAELVAEAARRFNERRYSNIFSIALGEAADPAYLQQAVAAPTGGEVLVAQHASDLLDTYLEVYARAGDDRYVDRVSVQPNTLTPFMNVQADQQVTQISIVLLRGNTDGRIHSLLTPNGLDLAKPSNRNALYRSVESTYELYKATTRSGNGLTGDWEINVAQQSGSATVVMLSRSRLRIRMPSPISLQLEDPAIPRYWPAGRPVLFVAGAQSTAEAKWVTDLAPVVRPLKPVAGAWVTLTDDGREYDAAKDDGIYTGLLPPFAAEGDYPLEIEMPGQRKEPIHIRKQYHIRIASLPTMTLNLPEVASTLPIYRPFTGLIDLPGRADFEISEVTFPFAFVKRPDGVLDPVVVQRSSDSRFQFQYTPSFTGSYQVRVAAAVKGRGPMGSIRYVDFTESAFTVPATVPLVSVGLSPRVSTAFSNGKRMVYDGDGVLKIPFVIDSQASQRQLLQVRVEGMPGSTILPEQLPVEPNQVMRRTMTVRLPAEARPPAGQLTIVFTAPEGQVIVQGNQIGVPFRADDRALTPVLIGLAVVMGLGGLYYHHWRQRKQSWARGRLRRAA
jgi:Mg-chelatase subunit ChlD